MNTQIKDLAAKLNYFQLSDIPKEYTQPQILNGSTYDYSTRIDNNYTLPSDLLQKYEHGLFWECKKQYKNSAPNEVELYYIEHSRVLFLSPKGNLLRLVFHKNKYHFSLDYSHYREVQNISFHKREQAIKESGLVEPNLIGVFTDKKILEWFNYCDMEAELNTKLVSQSNNKNTEIENEIQSFIDSVKCTVQKYNSKTYVDTDLFSIVFTHDKSSQYLSHTVTFKGSLNDIIKISS